MKKLIKSILFLSIIGIFSSVSIFTSCSKATATPIASTSTYQNKMLIEKMENGFVKLYTMNNDGTNWQQVSITLNTIVINTNTATTDGTDIFFIGEAVAGQKNLYKVSLSGGSPTLIKSNISNSSVRIANLY